MSRYNNYGAPPHSASSNKSFNSGLGRDRHDDRASHSGSDDGNYAVYPDVHKIEPDLEVEDDPNAGLTLQTLNADGTPKRPMNAFMIFARRRRPQVSAENQAMRTGEISKILSKEWVAMTPADKQFYLEQAKQLKETFNSRYPDYVYRRRPNNSRKRRRPDGGATRPLDPEHPEDGGSVDLEVSPSHHNDSLEASLPPSYTRSPYPMQPPPLNDHGKYSRTNGGHAVSPDGSYRSGAETGRASYGGPYSERSGNGISPRLSLGNEGMQYGYNQNTSSTNNTSQSPPMFGGSDNSISPQQPWQPRWLGGSPHDRVPNSLAPPKLSPYSTPSSGPWTGANDSHSHSHPPPPHPPSNPSPTSPNFFPTLNTPFYPNGAPTAPPPPLSPYHSSASTVPQSPSLGAPPSPYEPLSSHGHGPAHGHGHGHMTSRNDFAPRGYPSSSITPGSSYPTGLSGRESSLYAQRNLPPVQTNSGYSSQPPSSSSSGHGQGHSNSFWPRS